MEPAGGWLHLRRLQERRDQLQDIGIALVRIIEAWCIDKEYALPIEGEFIGKLDLGSTGFQVCPDTKIGTAAHIDELYAACQFA